MKIGFFSELNETKNIFPTKKIFEMELSRMRWSEPLL